MSNASRHAVVALWLCLPLTAAADPMPPCSSVVAAGGALAPWSAPVQRAAGSDSHQLADASISPGQALRLTLHPQDQVKFLSQPARPGTAGSQAGLLNLTVTEPGTYRVALGTAAWIDMLDSAAAAMPASAHTHGPACSGIHKIVDFALQPGRYTLQISANAELQTTVLVVRSQ